MCGVPANWREAPFSGPPRGKSGRVKAAFPGTVDNTSRPRARFRDFQTLMKRASLSTLFFFYIHVIIHLLP